MELTDVKQHPNFISSEFRLSLKQKQGCKNTKKKHYITIVCEKCKETVTKTFEKKYWHFVCGKCARGRKSTDKFVQEAINLHGGRYTYSNTKYINNATKVAVTCPIHEDFYTRPTDFLAGTGCPVCAARSKSQVIPKHLEEVPCQLYWVFFQHLDMYKLGVTTQPLSKRFQHISEGHILVWSEILTYQEAVKIESYIKKKFIIERYQGNKELLKGGGTYELFLSNMFPTYTTLKEIMNGST